MRQPAYTRPFPSLYLPSPTSLDGVLVGRGGRRAFERQVSERPGLLQKMVTPCLTRWSRVYVAVVRGDLPAGTVTLAGEHAGTVVRDLPDVGPGYAPRTPHAQTGKLLDAIGRDYPPTSPTFALAAALRELLDLWALHQQAGSPGVPLKQVDHVIGEHLRPHLAAWVLTHADDPDALPEAL